ncbi:MAG: Hpt domain-containing protein [Alphaproteobacteria bacterium]|nr:Hpt domain-containing protein [Alphaproteobacteria bacterium]
MNIPVNLDNVREMLGGDPAREKELFGIYMEASEECLTIMEANFAPENEENWRRQAHSLKGMSMNLGAEVLGKLCAEAQNNNTATPDEKKTMLTAIQDEYKRVKEYLFNQPSMAAPS